MEAMGAGEKVVLAGVGTGSLAETVFSLYSRLRLDSQSIITKWREALDIQNDEDLLETMAFISRMVSTLVLQVQDSKRIGEKARQNYLHAVNGLQEVIRVTSFHQQSGSFSNKVNDDKLNLVLALDDILKHEAPVPILPAEEITKLLTRVDELIREINASALPVHLKSCMLKALMRVQWALQHLDVLGPSVLRGMIFSSFSTLFDGPDLDGEKEDNTSEKLSNRALSIMKDMLSLIDGAERAIKRGSTVLVLAKLASSVLISSAN